MVEANIAKDANVIVGCQADVRSQHAAELMQQIRYTNVANMIGGGPDRMGRTVPGWQPVGLPVSIDNGGEVSYASRSEKVGMGK